MNADDLRLRLQERPERTALLFDFDGTLAPIVEHPQSAAPSEGAIELLERLADRFGRVAVVSGRPLSFLDPLIPTSIDIAALYGLEFRIDGVASHHEEADAWRAVVDELVDDPAVPEGAVVEPKRFSLTVHYRTAPQLEPAVQAWADGAAAATGLVARPAKASIELHPPIDADKGTATLAMADGCETVVFVGDDVGDLPAFDVLDELRSRGTQAIKIASGHGDELPPEVAEAADLLVGGPDDVLALFSPLVR